MHPESPRGVKDAQSERTGREGMKWSVEQRLSFIDFRLCWEGRVNRSDLQDYFGISIPQASADLRQYLEYAPANAFYDRVQKSYVRSSSFIPVFVSDNPSTYLHELLSLNNQEDGASFIGSAPPIATMPQVVRRIDPNVFRTVLGSVRNGLALEIAYQSMSREKPSSRWISPHAFAFDGFRWHIRSYCHEQEDFRDFVLARILSIGGQAGSTAKPSEDTAWHQYVTVRIAPDPGLSAGQQQAIAWDYGMEGGGAALTVRAALAFYVLKQLRLDRASDGLSPEARQIVLLNKDELEPYRGGN